MNTRFIVASLLFVSVLALSAMACSVPIQISFGEDETAAPQWNEEPESNGPQGEEPQFEEPHFEEPHPEEHQFEAPHFEEPHPEEHQFEEPHFEEQHEPEPHPEEPSQEPQNQQVSSPVSSGSNNGQGANWETDVAVTDIYAGNQPHGQIHARITNHGPGTLNNVQVEVLCGMDATHKSNGQMAGGDQIVKNLKLNLQPGETYSFPTGLKIDTNTFSYGVGCQVSGGFNDPNAGNDYYWEEVK
jgi:hypothetical protein